MQTEEEAEAFLELLPDAVVIVDREGHITYINGETERMFGYSRAEVRGVAVEILMPERFRKRHSEQHAKYFSDPRVEPMGIGLEKYGRRRDGSEFPVDIMVSPFRTRAGSAFIAVARDVSDRKRMEEDLLKANRGLRMLSRCNEVLVHATEESDLLQNICRIVVEIGGYRLAWVGFAEHDNRKRVRPVAQAGCEQEYLDGLDTRWSNAKQGRGPTGQAIRLGKPSIMRDILRDPNYEPWRAQAAERGFASSIALPLTAGGSTFGALNVYSARPDAFDGDEVKLLMELAADLAYGIMVIRTRAQHKRTDEALRSSEHLLANVLRLAPDAVISVDEMQHIRLFNRAAEVIFGYSAEEVEGKPLDVLLPERFVELHHAHVQEFSQSPAAVRYMNQRGPAHGRRRNGTEFPAECAISKVESDGQKTFVAVVRDITERVQAEETLQESNHRLEKALGDLKAAESQLVRQERLNALAQMAGGIAHDFNNALTGIIGFSDLLLSRRTILNDREQVTRYLRLINTTAMGAASTVHRMREFYRTRQDTDVYAPVNINQVVEQAISLTQPKWKNEAEGSGSAISIHTELEQVPRVEGNEGELRDALVNLIFNAVDALAPPHRGEGPSKQGIIGLRTRDLGDHVIVEVTDTGVGMTEEVRRRCLEPFFTTKGQVGTGLGLAMVHGTVQRHNGSIDIASALGEGTTVSIRLPVHGAQKGEGSWTATPAASRPPMEAWGPPAGLQVS
ncbi:MAG: PAS domain S-box protein [Chloroflexi bacterium]|nr:PAS domain S-box protein [Chloroflexota bacterium]